MIATIVYVVGLVLAFYAVYEIFAKKQATDLPVKILAALFVLLTSWVGLICYYFIIRDKLK